MNFEVEVVCELVWGNVDVMVGVLLSINFEMNCMNLYDMVIIGYVEFVYLLWLGVNKVYVDLILLLNSVIDGIFEVISVVIYKWWNNVKSYFE